MPEAELKPVLPVESQLEQPCTYGLLDGAIPSGGIHLPAEVRVLAAGIVVRFQGQPFAILIDELGHAHRAVAIGLHQRMREVKAKQKFLHAQTPVPQVDPIVAASLNPRLGRKDGRAQVLRVGLNVFVTNTELEKLKVGAVAEGETREVGFTVADDRYTAGVANLRARAPSKVVAG